MQSMVEGPLRHGFADERHAGLLGAAGPLILPSKVRGGDYALNLSRFRPM